MTDPDMARRRADLILPKLEAARRSAGGSRIHDVLQHLALVSNYRQMIDSAKRVPVEVLAQDLVECCDKAEKFLANFAK